MLVFVAGCIYYMKTVDLSSRFAKQGTQSATKQNTPVRSSTDRSAAGVSATPQQPVDIEYTRQLNSLVASLNTDLAPSDASHSLAQLGIDLHFEPYAFPKGLGVRGTIRTENAASLISSADPSLRFTTLSPLLPSLRRLAFVHRYISTGDPSTDDPASAFHQDHAFCSGKRQQGRGGGKGKEKGRKRKGGGDAVGRRCRRARFKDLEQLWREAPAAVWPLVQEAVIDVVDERITKGTPQDPDAYARLRERKMWRSGLLKVQIDPK
jgi:hypothetical protein